MKRLLTLIVFTVMLSGQLLAAVPPMINYQGRLTDAGESPVPDGNYSVVFTIYDAASGGASKWTETQNVTTTGGLFALLLGSVNPILDTVFNGTTRYIGVQVGADPELTPRTAMVSVPYAQRVSTVDGASGGRILSPLEVSIGNSTGFSTIFGRGNDTNFYFGAVQEKLGNGIGDKIGSIGVQYIAETFPSSSISFRRGNFASQTYMTFATSTFRRMIIDTNGNVGIGNQVTPGAMLEIRGYGTSRDGGLRLRSFNDNYYWNIHLDDNGDGLIFSHGAQWPVGPYSYLLPDNAGLITTSDRRSKKDIEPIDQCLDLVMALKPSTFRFKIAQDGTPLNYGFIAQEMKEQFPDLVLERDGLLTLVSQGLIAINTKAIQEIKNEKDAQIRDLQHQIDELKKSMQELAQLKQVESSTLGMR